MSYNSYTKLNHKAAIVVFQPQRAKERLNGFKCDNQTGSCGSGSWHAFHGFMCILFGFFPEIPFDPYYELLVWFMINQLLADLLIH